MTGDNQLAIAAKRDRLQAETYEWMMKEKAAGFEPDAEQLEIIQDNERRFAAEYIGKVKHTNDSNWRKAQAITGNGDYTPADNGEPPYGV